MKLRALGLAVLAAATLAACGGSDSTSSGGGLSSYAGTWLETCNSSRTIENTSGDRMNEQVTHEYTSSGNNLTVMLTTKVYQPTDAACTGTVAATHVQNGTFTYKNNVTLKFNGVDVTGQEMSMSIGKIGGLSSGTTITIGSLVYPGDYFQTAVNLTSVYLYLKDNQVYGIDGDIAENDITIYTDESYLTKVQ